MTGAALALRGGSGDRRIRWLAAVSAVASLASVSTAAQLAPRPGVTVDPSVLLMVGLAILTLAGLALAWARPRNPIGWLLLGPALLQAVSEVTAGYAQAGYGDPGALWPGALFAAWLGAWTWFPSIALPVAVLPALYPSGRPPSRRWRRVAWSGALGTTCVTLALTLQPEIDAGVEPRPDLPVQLPGWLGIAFIAPGFALLAVAAVGGLVATVFRTLHAEAPERQQLAWLLTALLPVP